MQDFFNSKRIQSLLLLDNCSLYKFTCDKNFCEIIISKSKKHSNLWEFLMFSNDARLSGGKFCAIGNSEYCESQFQVLKIKLTDLGFKQDHEL